MDFHFTFVAYLCVGGTVVGEVYQHMFWGVGSWLCLYDSL